LIGFDLPEQTSKWREQCRDVYHQCESGTVYSQCPNSCLKSCSHRDNEHESNDVCRQQCLAGCVCSHHNYFDTKQNLNQPVQCKQESQCSCYDEQKKEYHRSGAIVKRGQCSTW